MSYTPLAQYFLDLMRVRRIDSERELARQAGVSSPTINKVMNGGSVRADTLQTIADNLNLPVTDLLKAAGYNVEEKQDIKSRLVREIVRLMDRLDEDDQEEILAIARVKAERYQD